MMRCTPILLLCVALMAACATPRKACRKAERHVARAVWLCPDILHRDSVAVAIPPARDTIAARPAVPDLDSLLAACRALNVALAAAQAHGTAQAPAPGVKQAVAHLQHAACNWPGFTEHVGRITITVRNIDGAPALTVDDPGELRKVPCPPAVANTVITGVSEWYRTAFWSLVGMVVLVCASFVASHRY